MFCLATVCILLYVAEIPRKDELQTHTACSCKNLSGYARLVQLAVTLTLLASICVHFAFTLPYDVTHLRTSAYPPPTVCILGPPVQSLKREDLAHPNFVRLRVVTATVAANVSAPGLVTDVLCPNLGP